MRRGCEEHVEVGPCPHCPCHDEDDVLECCHCGELSEYDPDDPWFMPNGADVYDG